ncbi:MAG: iron-sulfur cluster assembly protein [Verrucomicrobiota bacterium]
MITVDSLRPADVVIFAHDCAATQIPYGNIVTVPKGTEAHVGQTLGGNVTLQVAAFGLVQVMSKDTGSLTKDGVAVAAGGVGSTVTHQGPADEKQVWEELKACYDPEIPVNIVDLGLVYDVKLTPMPSGNSRVDVKMTLTAMGCGMGPVIAQQARDRLLTVPGVAEADVQIVWDPPWNQSMVTDAGKKRLGIW